MGHPWYTNGPCATIEEIGVEFLRRKTLVDQENENKRLERESERDLKKQQLQKEKENLKAGVAGKPKKYVHVDRGDGDST
jgi:hypothetical protein